MILSGTLSGIPTVQPSVLYTCPNTAVTYSCHASNVTEMSWKVEPYNSLVIFTPAFIYAHNETSIESVDTRLFGNLTSIDFNRENTLVADNITTTVTFHNSEYENGTMVICQTFYIYEKFTSSAILYFAGRSL